MEIKRIRDYGVDKSIDNRLLIIREIRISGNSEWTKEFLGYLDKWYSMKIKNYNCKGIKLKVYDYYMWCNVLENEENDYSYITLTYNKYNGVKGCIDTMSKLENILIDLDNEFYIKGVNVSVMMNTIDSLVEDINNDIEFEKSIEKRINDKKVGNSNE